MLTIEELVAKAKEDGASDIHVICGLPVKYRVDGELVNLTDAVLTQDDCLSIAEYLSGNAYEIVEELGELDLSGDYAGVRCRVHIFKQQGIPSIALRLLRDHIPALESLGLPDGAQAICELRKGIVLVTGETGSGKSTTLASVLDRINHSRRAHIVTLEDPIEYLHTSDLCAINQREVGKDTRSFSSGLRACLREDPDVIMIGEMRDRDTIETAITAAETGHLVFATLHTGSAKDSVDRIVQVFPEGQQTQIRLQLSMCLEAVLTQQLVPGTKGGRVLVCEYMPVNGAIRNNIREGNTAQIANIISTSRDRGGISMDQALENLVVGGRISVETAIMYAHDREALSKRFAGGFSYGNDRDYGRRPYRR